MEIRNLGLFEFLNERCRALAEEENRANGTNATHASIRENVGGITDDQWKRWRNGRNTLSARKFGKIKNSLSLRGSDSDRANKLFAEYRLFVGPEKRSRRSAAPRDRLTDEELNLVEATARDAGIADAKDLGDPSTLSVFARAFMDPRFDAPVPIVSMQRASQILIKLMRSKIMSGFRQAHRDKLILMCHWYALLSADLRDDEDALREITSSLKAHYSIDASPSLSAYCRSAFPAMFSLNLDAYFLPTQAIGEPVEIPGEGLFETAFAAAEEFDSQRDNDFLNAGIKNLVSSAEYNLWRTRAFRSTASNKEPRAALERIDRLDEQAGAPPYMRMYNWLGIADTMLISQESEAASDYLGEKILLLDSSPGAPRFQLGRAHFKRAIAETNLAKNSPRGLHREHALALVNVAINLAAEYQNETQRDDGIRLRNFLSGDNW